MRRHTGEVQATGTVGMAMVGETETGVEMVGAGMRVPRGGMAAGGVAAGEAGEVGTAATGGTMEMVAMAIRVQPVAKR